MFSQNDLKQHIEQVLNEGNVVIPDGHKIAFVTNFDGSGLHSAVAVKINDEWQVSGAIEYHPSIGDWSTGVSVRWSK